MTLLKLAVRSDIHSRFSPLLLLLILFSLFIPMDKAFAEGTKTWQPDPSSKSDLYVTSPTSNAGGVRSFAGYLSHSNMKMYVHIKDPGNEMVYLGFSGSGYQFRIVSPTGAIVHSGTVSSPNVTNYNLAFNGPDVLGNGGYSTTNALFKFDPQGLPSGDYSIEFAQNLLMPWFDVTVTTKDAIPQEITGRLWSQAWQVSCGSFSAALKAKFYARDERGYVTQVNFAEAGIKPYVGQFSFNDTGTGSTGNVAEDRKSVPNAQSGNPVQKVFLNQPDPDVYPLGVDGEIQNLPLKVDDPANPDVTIEVTQPGRVEVVLDFGTIGNYQEAVDKRLFADLVTGVNTIPWDGTRGDGEKVQPQDFPIPVTISYTQGETHFTAYDVEYLDESFVVRTQTTSGLTSPNVLFWDDSRISQSPGLPPNKKVDTDVGSVARQPWSNFDYGNYHTINTWWFAYRDYVDATVLMPGDYGDAPESYGGAAHKIPTTPTIYLGAIAPDKESQMPAALDGTGDDADTKDEDALSSIPNLYTISTDYNLTIPCVGGGTVAAWIDFDQSGEFDDGERQAAICGASGSVSLSWSSLTGLSEGTTYIRLRTASDADQLAKASGGASDGEVEDYALQIKLPNYDYGDAPNDGSDFNYGIAKHIIPDDGKLSIGAKKAKKDEESEISDWTTEWTGTKSKSDWYKNNKEKRKEPKKPKNENKDKKNRTDNPEDYVEPRPEVVGDGDEEDGLEVTAYTWDNSKSCTGLLPNGTVGTITMTESQYCLTTKASNASSISAQLVAWIDFNQNGVFDDPTERSVVDVDGDVSNDDTQGNVPAGTDNQDVVLYWDNLDKLSGEINTFIRMRLTSDPQFKSNHSPDPIGVAINGEVEDTALGINTVGTDYGDAAASYGDASHTIELYAYMGTTIDNEATSQNTANAGADGTGDDVIDTANHNYNDDDGVASFPLLDTNAQSYSLDVTVTSPTAATATLVGWIDFDVNGVFDSDEAATLVVPQNTTEGIVTLQWTNIPADIQGGASAVRLRLTTDTTIATGTASTSLPTGLAVDGEVEDYNLDIKVGWPVAPVTGPGDGGQCLLTHHTNSGVAADPNSFYNIGDHTNPSTLSKIGSWNVPSGTVEGLTADVANEKFYALNADRSGKLWLGNVDPLTGSFSDITTVGSSTLSHSTYGSLSIASSRGIAHQPGTNTLWVAAYNVQPSSGPGSTYVYLFKMSTQTGEVMTGAFAGEDYLAIDLAPYTFNTSNDRPSVEALTFYKNEPNILYGVLSTLSGGTPKVGHLFAVDLSKANPQAVLAPKNLSGVSYSGGAAPASTYYDIEGMSFDENGDLVIISSNVGGGNANSLYDVDLTTGEASNKRTIISGDWEGIVCDPLFAEKDYGDAPADMSSIDASLTAVYGDASHVLDETTYLGLLADGESESQNSGLNADGDDTVDSNDDDGVVFPKSDSTNVLRVGQSNTLTVTASTAGVLNAWVDWNQDGDWDDVNEQIATDLVLVAGANPLSVTPQATSTQGKTYARFRFSSISGLASTGVAADGEVEDYAVNLTLATPVNVCSPTLLNNGFENPTVPSGLIIDLEDTIEGWSTQAVNPASGSNYTERNSIEIWESGFQGVPAYQGNQFAELNAYVSGALYQDVELPPGTTLGWSFAHRARTGTNTIKVLMGPPDAPISQGQFTSGTGAWEVYSGAYTVPAGQTITRFAFQSVDAGSLGNFIDAIQLPGGCDFGDAPNSYLTTLSSTGAYHIGNSLLHLGDKMADSEEAAFGGDDIDTSGTANDDDAEGDAPDDEDGVASFAEIDDLDTSYTVSVSVNNTTGSQANLVGWIDFDGNGTFDSDEAATLAVANNTSGAVNLQWNAIPTDITSGDTFVRLRLTSDSTIATGDATTSNPAGMAADGEIEDYPLFIKVGGFPVKGRVYKDSNVDGVNNTSEVGVSGLPVVLLDVTNNTCVSTRTDADGNYEFFPVIPGEYKLYEASRETIPTPQNCDVTKAKDPAGYRSTTSNALAQFSVVDAEITGKDFGDVQGPTLEPDNSGSVIPGNAIFYAHKFTPKSTGTVTFASTNSGSAVSGWNSTLYEDADCSGQLDGAEGSTPIGSNLATTANTPICLINKVFAPGNAASGENWKNEIAASFDFGNVISGTTTLTATDFTKVAANDSNGNSRLELKKTVENLTQVTAETTTQNQGKPGDVLKYRIYYRNSGTSVLSDLHIKDVVPAFTTLNGSPVCETPLPASLTNCTPGVSGENIEWIFPVADELQGGGSGVVSYEVTIEN